MTTEDGANIPLQEKPDSLNNMNASPTTESYQTNIHPAPSDSDDNMSHVHGSHADRLLENFRHRTLCVVVFLAVTVSLLACVLSIIAIVKYSDAASELRTARENREKVCLPCDQQRIQLSSWKQTNEAGDCCVQLQEVLYMMEEIAQEQARKQIDKKVEELSRLTAGGSSPFISAANSSLQQTRPSAHLVLLEDTATDTADIPWQNPADSKLSHITDGLSIANKGRIKISSPGYYFIYSSVTFSDFSVDTNTETVTAQHHIYTEDTLQSLSATKLMSDKNMVWKSLHDRTYSQQTSYLGGSFYLKADSYVYVLVDDDYDRKPLKGCQQQECYFGLFKL